MGAAQSDLRADYGTAPRVASPVHQSFAGCLYTLTSVSKYSTAFSFCNETKSSIHYEPDLARYLPTPTLKPTKRGTAAVRQPRIPKQQREWWQAQCRFRGLSRNGDVSDMQARLQKHGDKGLSKKMQNVVEQLREEYEEKNRTAIEDIWDRDDNDQKAKAWPRRFLCEYFEEDGLAADEEVLVVEVGEGGLEIQQLADRRHIACYLVRLPKHEPDQHVAVLGHSHRNVTAKVAELQRDSQRALLRAKRDRKEKEKGARDDHEHKVKQGSRAPLASKKQWDVRGKWKIRCPELEGYRRYGDEECSLEISLTQPDEAGLVQMYATFDFILLTGIMRFANQEAQYTAQEDSQSRRRDDCIDNYESEDEDDEEEGERSTPAHFLLPKADLPSPSLREFKFRWRGEETGEGEIELGSDENLCSITFSSEHRMEGTFITTYAPNATFHGVKVQSVDHPTISESEQHTKDRAWADPGYLWTSRSEAAYERARIGRWH